MPTPHELGYETLAIRLSAAAAPRARTRRSPAACGADYEKYIREQYAKEKEIIEKLGWSLKT